MKELKFNEMVKRLIIPMFLLVGLVFASATTVSAQYKSAEDAKLAVQQELQIAGELLGPSLTDRTLANGQSQMQVAIKADLYAYLLTALNNGETALALQETSEKMSQKYDTPETSTLFLIAKQEAIDLLSE